MKTLYIEWKEPASNTWITVGRLSHSEGYYTFQYTSGASRTTSFTPFGIMTSLDGIYDSEELFPLFANRLLNKSRPEYRTLLEWLNLDESADSLDILSVSQGLRGTDSLRLFSLPEKTELGFECDFFVSGISHLSDQSVERIKSLSTGDQLYLMDDAQNEFKDSLTLRTSEPKALAGYCPGFMSAHLKKLLSEDSGSSTISVIRVNVEAPSPYRLLCNLRIDRQELCGFFDAEDYKTPGDFGLSTHSESLSSAAG